MDDPIPTTPGLQQPDVLPDFVANPLPKRISRYVVERVLGRGGFGIVYLAQDEQLHRPVAVKVPHRELVTQAEDAEPYLAEARTVARLDYPNIVTVHDVGSTSDFPFFAVSKYIEGSDLAQRLKEGRPSVLEAAELTAIVAETLQYAHRQGLVHRDIKPGNILLDRNGKPYVADFGLALKEENIGKGPRFAGTPAYMSPEQARGEGHRVDGRSDVFSLGIVFYEMLTGRRPFSGQTREEILDQITSLEARPLRQWDDAIPKELERICLKALAKRAADRYLTAKDMADDLRSFLEQSTEEKKSVLRFSVPSADSKVPGQVTTPHLSPLPAPGSDSEPIKMVPKGLRSFDAGDADFFLELLPGPRDRDGLPDSVRFWKTRVEETDPDNTFVVGLIYGPSGCGKSSLVKAGLLPRLAKHVTTVYVEATAEETETRLLKGLRRQLPDAPDNIGLIEVLSALRQGRFLRPDQKVLLILDQFEQWLHAKRSKDSTELVQALRHCDRGRLQCVVMVRDDFWLAVSRFMQALEIRLVEAENSRLVDLFDLKHARKVLTAFGRAFGDLPDQELSKDQQSFLEASVAGLAQDGKVVSVRLALFAEMMKGRPWTPASLKAVGGTEGVGVTFLEETFATSTAPPQHRLHQKAAQAVLRTLLAEPGTDIKGHMRSRQELLEASGYANRPNEFEELIRILDSELRLITPTDPEGKGSSEPGASATGQGKPEGDEQSEPGASATGQGKPVADAPDSDRRFYQLTHDYLVPSLRNWLTRKQKETRRGRAELLLGDRAAVWNARPENRQLPSLAQWLQIKWLTNKNNWTPAQRKMMAIADKVHAARGIIVALLLAILAWSANELHGRMQAHSLRDRLLSANINEVKAIVDEMSPYRRWVDDLLRQANEQAEQDKDRSKQLRTSLALLAVDDGQVNYLCDRLLDAEPNEVAILRDSLAPKKDQMLDKLWKVVEAPQKGKESQRLRAASALAKYDPDSEKWEKYSEAVCNDLVSVPTVHLSYWLECLRSVRSKMFDPLTQVFRNTKSPHSERTLALEILADYAADQPQLLAELLLDADPKEFTIIFSKLNEQGQAGLPVLTAEIETKIGPEVPLSAPRRENLAKRQANAAVVLLRLNQPEHVWPLLKYSRDPRVRSYLIHRFSALGADAQTIVQRLRDEPDITIRRALILSLGEFDEDKLSLDAREALRPKLQEIYLNDPDAGVHSAVEWLLRRWKREPWINHVNEKWAKDSREREKRLKNIRKSLADGELSTHSASVDSTPRCSPQWYVNSQGQTMVVIPAPAEFLMGSPLAETGRQSNERQHWERLATPFAVAATAVKVQDFQAYYRLRFGKESAYSKEVAPTSSCPVNGISWFMAAEYCNWLSEQEKIPKEQWCYETDPIGNVTNLKANYRSLQGYRLPTEAEWEYACRAGTVTSRYYGETEELVGFYAWYRQNSKNRSWPVGMKKPNDWGLFDMHGNVCTWSQDAYSEALANGERIKEEEEGIIPINKETSRWLRGGSFQNFEGNLRSAYHPYDVPTTHDKDTGFRLARSLPIVHVTALPAAPKP